MWAVSVRAPLGSLALGRAPFFAWGAPSGVADVLNLRDDTEYRGDLLIHQSRTPAPELKMKFREEDHMCFPRGALLGVVRLKAVLPPGVSCKSTWSDERFFRWVLAWPRAFEHAIPWHGAPGLFDVCSSIVDRACAQAQYEATATWRSWPEVDRESLIELAGKFESDGYSTDDATRRAIEQFQRDRAERSMTQAQRA